MEVRVLIPKQLSLIPSTNFRPRREKKSVPKKYQRKHENENTTNSSSSNSPNSSPISSDNSESSESESGSHYDRKLGISRKSRELSLDNVEIKQEIGGHRLLERSQDSESKLSVKIFTTTSIQKGTVFTPNEGQIQVLNLVQMDSLPENDIRFLFGCFDQSIDDPESGIKPLKRIHVCNWVRFLEPCHSGNNPTINLVGKFTADKKLVFEFQQDLDPGTEIRTFFDVASVHPLHSPGFQVSGESPRAFTPKHEDTDDEGEAPLDLSKSLKLYKSPGTEPDSESDNSSDQSTEGQNLKVNSSSSSSTTPSKPSVKSHPFSITNVLQPMKLFQPHLFSPVTLTPPLSTPGNTTLLSSPTDTNSTLNSPNSYQGTRGHAHAHLQILSHHHASTTGTATAILRPILRTRGRERSLLPCDVCGKAFDRPSLLKRHMRTHTGEKPHICDVCSKGFSTSSSLNTHRRIHSGEKPHACPICNKRFTASSNLYYHRMTHNKEKPHKCLQCFKSFPTPGDLKSHQYVHSGSWPYNCAICKRGFSKQTNLRNHLLLHSGTGDKPHVCTTCGKKFALACNLRAHLRTHDEDPISACVSCKRTFLTSLNMLVNGQCRPCILHGKSPLGTTTPASSMESVATRGICDATSGFSPATAAQHHHALLHGLNPGMLHPPQQLMHGFHVPGLHGNPMAGNVGQAVDSTRPNPFLEQLFEWNWRFAKETAGNLGFMQQKLIESQMLAAQLMSVSSTGGNPTISDLLRFRQNLSPSESLENASGLSLNLNSNFGQ